MITEKIQKPIVSDSFKTNVLKIKEKIEEHKQKEAITRRGARASTYRQRQHGEYIEIK